MHSNFYTSGFLYHPDTQQILLQQNSTEQKLTWNLLGSPSQRDEIAEKDFRQIAQKLLKLKLAASAIHQVYDYYHAAMRKKHVVTYAEVNTLKTFPATEKFCFSWFSMKEILKLGLSTQTKQDIIVGQRVIGAKVRETNPIEQSPLHS